MNEIKKLSDNIGRKCKKRSKRNLKQSKKFKSGRFVNTISGVINHPKLDGQLAYVFEEDDSFVDCKICEILTEPMTFLLKDQDRVTLKQTIALLNSMCRSEESHSKKSSELVQESFKILNNLYPV